MKIEGVVVPLVTPLTNSGCIDRDNLRKLIKYVLDGGASALMPTAGTGEGVGLSMRQRLEMVNACVEEVNGRCPVIPGIIVPGFGDCVNITLEYKKIGVDGVMLLAPYFTSFGGQNTLLEYFKRFIDLTDIPLMIENLPSRTGINMLPETFLALADYSPRFVAIKECTRDVMQFTNTLYYMKNKVSVLCGFESMMAISFILGATGGVIATANLFPQIYVRLLKAAYDKELDIVNEIHFNIIRPLDKIAYLSPNPGPIRYALECLGIETGLPILPVEPPTLAMKTQIKSTIEKIKNKINADIYNDELK